MRIAIYGGTFNPIHNAHLHLVQSFSRLVGFDKTILIPSNIPPHKSAGGLATGEQRLDMCALAADGLGMEISDMEIRRGGASYTADTLEILKKEYPGDSLFLIMGEDMFMTVDRWYMPEKIFSLCTLCAAPRSRAGLTAMCDKAKKLSYLGAESIIKDIEYLPISSTMVRDAVSRGEDISGLVPDAVRDYILKNSVYKD